MSCYAFCTRYYRWPKCVILCEKASAARKRGKAARYTGGHGKEGGSSARARLQKEGRRARQCRTSKSSNVHGAVWT
eukprot:6184778-Pleurochrysis_carterae.AAC.3